MATTGQYRSQDSPTYTASSYEKTLVMSGSRRRRRRWPRRLAIFATLCLILLGSMGAAAYEEPRLLAPLGTLLLGSSRGTVPWNGTDPLNLLVMGVDQRTTEQTRSDTMMILHIDPGTNRVTMLSVPRDMWIPMPSPGNTYGFYKINAAYAIGQQYNQGPEFAELAVEGTLHIPINYYAVIRFSGFKNVVDALGGVNVCVPSDLYDTQYPDDSGYGMHTIHIKMGCQHMNGTVALEYARERHGAAQGDLSRNQQQQRIVSAIEKGFLSPSVVARLPSISTAVKSAVQTNLPGSALPQLGVILGKARGNNVQHIFINVAGGYVSSMVSSDGQDVLEPNWPAINGLVDPLFPLNGIADEHATVQILNGQHAAGVAAFYTGLLGKIGFTTLAAGNADRESYVQNKVVHNLDAATGGYTSRVLSQMFAASLSEEHLGASGPAVQVILGSAVPEGA